MTFHTEKKQKKHCYFGDFREISEPMLRWECGHVCHDGRTGKDGIYGKYSKYQKKSWHTSDLHLRHKAAKTTFFSKI